MISCDCVTVAVYCVIALLLIGNCPEDRILFNALMHGTVNTGLYRISNLGWEFSFFQHSEWIRWLQGIVKRWVMKVCTGLVWLMIRCGSGYCKRGKEASSCACCRVTQLASVTQRSTESTSVAGHSSQHNITQHVMLPLNPTGTTKLICDFSKEDYRSLRMVLGTKHVGMFLMF